MPGSMKNDDAALVKEMKSGPSRRKKREREREWSLSVGLKIEGWRWQDRRWIQGLQSGGRKGS